MEILEEWIAGRGKHPVTWNTLVEVLHDIELSALAREIEAIKLPTEERPTQDSNQRTILKIEAVNFQQKMLKVDLLKTLKRELSVTFVLELLKIRLSGS